MRVILFDIDTLRADHMGCYGYGRDTTPVIDEIAKEGVCFDRYYCPNAPCLPSRASMVTGLYGIHNGIVGHGGTAADLRLQGESRSFTDLVSENGLFMQFKRAGFHTVSFSSFAERHSAWWFLSGLDEYYNPGLRGGESAEMVTPSVLQWLDKNRDQDNWFLHVHYWDPHTPYRTPEGEMSRFQGTPLPDDWITDEIFGEHLRHIGPHGVNEINMWDDETFSRWPKHPGSIKTREEAKHFIDLYDDSVRFTDDNIGLIIGWLKDQGLYGEDLAVIITADHGEDLGEFGVYGEHGMADEPVCRIPLIIKWPGIRGGRRLREFYDNTDLLPTVKELLGTETFGDYHPDGISFKEPLFGGKECGRSEAVLTQCAHVCQRSVRFDQYIYIRTIHGGYHLLPEEMVFDLERDPHQLCNLVEEHPELCGRGARLLLDWTERMMKRSSSDKDPMWTVMREGGPEHCRGRLETYMERLKETGREYGIPLLKEQYREDLKEQK